MYCFGHRLNNILKLCFFQDKKTKKNVAYSSSDDRTRTTQQNISSSVLNLDGLSDDFDSDSSEIEENHQECNLSDEETWIRLKRKANEKAAAQQISVEDIPEDAKRILFALKQTKKLVKYVKKVCNHSSV